MAQPSGSASTADPLPSTPQPTASSVNPTTAPTSEPPVVSPSPSPTPSPSATTPPAESSAGVTTSQSPTSSDNPGASSGSEGGGAGSASGTTSSSGQSVNPTTSGGGGGRAVSSGASGSATPLTSSSSGQSQAVSTSFVRTTITLGDGTIVTSSAPVEVTSTAGGSSGGGTNTGAIVGGVVGGVVGAILLAGLLFFFLRKRRRSHRDDFDDMMFDPTRAQNHAQVDLADQGPNTVDPYYAPGVASTAATSPQMSQYGSRSATTTGSEGYGAQDLSRGPSSAALAGFVGRGAGPNPQGFDNAPPMPSIPGEGEGGLAAGAAAGGLSAKQREAYNEHQRFRVANQGGYGQHQLGSGAGPSGGSSEPMSPTGTTGGVTVHEDAGAADGEERFDQSEIPPTYDSIRR